MPDNNHMDFGVDLLPVTDKGYSLGKSDKRWKIFADEIDGTIKANNIMPILSKDFTTGKYGQDGTGTHYYETLGTITPDVFEKMWLLRYIISIEVPNDTTYTYRADVSFYGVRNTYSAYKIFNSYYSKYPIYQHFLVEGSSSSYPHEFGYRLASSYGDTTLNKNVTIDIIETRNCTVSFFDSPKAYTSTAPTNYTYRTFNATSNGLQETSDDNTITRLYAGNNTMKTSTTMRLAGSSLYGFDRDNRAQGISLYNNGYDSTTTSINTARVYNTAGFDWTKGLFYNTGGNYATNSDIYPGIDQSNHAIDFRYTDNCVNSSALSTLGLERYKAVYLKGTLGSDGLFYLAPITVTYNNTSYKRAWTQDIPSTEDGYVYWFIGFPYYNSSYAGGYQLNFYLNNNLYWYHDGKFQEYATPITKASIGLGNVENTALSTWTGSNNITTVGTITAGTWNGTTIAVANGGTGATSASGARTNLGLGAAAVKGVTDNSSNADVTSSDTNLITGRTLYYQLAKKGYTTNTGTVTSVATGVGLTGGTITTSGTLKANLTSDTALSNAAQSVTESASRVYPVRIDKNSKLAVVVPWTDTNTLVNYSLAATTKAYLMASSNAPTSTKTAREAIGDTGVYLTATSGELSSLRYSWHDTSSTPVEKAYTVWNSTDLSIDFVFN